MSDGIRLKLVMEIDLDKAVQMGFPHPKENIKAMFEDFVEGLKDEFYSREFEEVIYFDALLEEFTTHD